MNPTPMQNGVCASGLTPYKWALVPWEQAGATGETKVFAPPQSKAITAITTTKRWCFACDIGVLHLEFWKSSAINLTNCLKPFSLSVAIEEFSVKVQTRKWRQVIFLIFIFLFQSFHCWIYQLLSVNTMSYLLKWNGSLWKSRHGLHTEWTAVLDNRVKRSGWVISGPAQRYLWQTDPSKGQGHPPLSWTNAQRSLLPWQVQQKYMTEGFSTPQENKVVILDTAAQWT